MEASRATEESFVIVWGYIYVCTRVKNYVNLYSINEISIFQKFKVLTEDIIDDTYSYKQHTKNSYLLTISYRLYLHNCGLSEKLFTYNTRKAIQNCLHPQV